MGVVKRTDSKYYWLNLERPGQTVKRESSGVLVDAPTPELRARQRELAEAVYAIRMADLVRGQHGLDAPIEMPFLTWAEWYETHKTAKKRSAERERSMLKRLRVFFARDTLDRIDRYRAEEYVSWRIASGINPHTANREVDVLKHMLATAVPKYVRQSPLIGMKRIRGPRRGVRILTLEEFRRLKTLIQKQTILKLDPVEGWALLVTAVDTFMRLGDLVALTPDQVFATHIHVEDPKIGPYDTTLSPRARLALQRLRRRHPDAPWMFPTLHKSKALVHGSTRKLLGNRPGHAQHAPELQAVRFFAKACELANVPHGRALRGVTFHSLRHTGATMFMASGGNLRDLMQQGGWSDLESVMRYAHPSTELIAAVKRMARL